MNSGKHGFRVLFLLILLVLLPFCATARNGNPTHKDSMPLIVRTGVYEGLVSVDGNSVIIITNYKSRSRVDYQVTGNLKARIAALDGQLVTVVGTARRQGWSGTIEVVKILKPKKIPPLSPPSRK